MTTARLKDRREVAQGTAAFTFALDGELTFEAGQTCDFTLPEPIYSDEHGNARTFSIVSSKPAPRATAASKG